VFHPPDRDARAAMLGRWWAQAPHEGAAKKLLLDLSRGHSGAALERAQEQANCAAARRHLDADITRVDVELAAKRTFPALTPEQVESVPS